MKKQFILTLFVVLLYASAYAADENVTQLTHDSTPGCDSYLYNVDDPGDTQVDRYSTVCETLGASANIATDGTIEWEDATDLDENGALNTDTVADNEIDYSAVTCADLTMTDCDSTWTQTQATPIINLQDSDDAAGTVDLNFLSSGGTNTIVVTFDVEESGGTPANYIELDGVNENIKFSKPLDDFDIGDTSTTISGSSGDLTVEGNAIYRAGGTDVPDGDVANALTITAQPTSSWDVQDSISTQSVHSGNVSLNESSGATTSGAYIVKVYAGNMSNSAADSVQEVLDDFDDALDAAGGLTDTQTKCYRMADVDTSYDDESIFSNQEGMTWTIINMWCDSDDSGMTFDFQIDDGTPADVNGGAGVVCNKTKDTVFGGDAGDQEVLDGETVDLDIIATVGSPTWATFCMTITKTD
jgi:hypothetical protein